VQSVASLEHVAPSIVPPEHIAPSVPPPEYVVQSVASPEYVAPSVVSPERVEPSVAPPESVVAPVVPPERLPRTFCRSFSLPLVATARRPPLVRFPPLIGPYTDAVQYPDRNDPATIDLDAACIMMLTSDLPDLFGVMARPANRKIPVRDLDDFAGWVYVISDPIVVRVYAGDDDVAREAFKAKLLRELYSSHGTVLSGHLESSLTLCKNQVNIPLSAMSKALLALDIQICRVQFFGMKWALTSAEPCLDYYIDRYLTAVGEDVPLEKNIFDYGTRSTDSWDSSGIPVYRFSDGQIRAGLIRERHVHEMCWVEDHGSIEFRPTVDPRLRKVKLYAQVCHAILSVIGRQFLDDMPRTMRTMHTRLRQFRVLLTLWEGMTPVERVASLGGLRLEVTVRTDRVIDGRRLCSELDHLHIDGVERAIGDRFDGGSVSFDDIIPEFRSRFDQFDQLLHGAYVHSPPEQVQYALTLLRHTIGWSGRNMDSQLREARLHLSRVSAHAARRAALQAVAEEPEFIYDGCELDDPETRRLIVDFIDNALWCLHGGFRDRMMEPLMLRRTDGGTFHKMVGRYHNRVSGARYYIGQYGARWRDHIVTIQGQAAPADAEEDVPSELMDDSSD
jgi:hypothetical protein